MNIEIRESKDGQFYAVIKGGNNEDWFTSELYPDFVTAHGSAENLIKAFAPEYPTIVDATT